MNFKNIVTGIIVFTSITISSCIKLEKIPQRPLSNSEMWNCYNKSDWNESLIRNALIGKWKWIYTYNYWTPDKARYTNSENLIIELLSDSTINIFNNNEFDFSTRWSIISVDGSLYELKLDSSNKLLYGRILICNDIVEFNDSYLDGIDNYFNRIE